MSFRRVFLKRFAWCALSLTVFPLPVTEVLSQTPAPGAIAHKVGVVKSISGSNVVLTTDSGPDITVVVEKTTPMKRLPPGETDLKNATAMELNDLQVGDRVLARGPASSEGQPFVASAVVVMTREQIAKKRQSERDDWDNRGVAGVVGSSDAMAKTIVISVAPGTTITIKASDNTKFLRYAPTSVKYADAKAGQFAQIKPGDQLRARGNRDATSGQVLAEDVISGSFRNVAGTLLDVAPTGNEIHVMDLLTKEPVTIRFDSGSQLRRLPPFLAEGLAQITKSSAAGTIVAKHGYPDLQRIIVHAPPLKPSDLQKGEAIMVVATPDESTAVTAITLLCGVEPILTASPSGAATLLSSWSFSGGASDQ